MKKLMVAIAAAATALGLYAADDGFKSGNGFDSMTAGVKTLTELNTDDGNAWSSTDEGAAMEVKAYASGEALADEYRPAKYVGEGGITQANYLNVKTALDKTLTRTIPTAMQLASEDAYVDTLVKFTACDEEITTLGDANAQIAVWVKEDDVAGTTNLMITAGYITAADGSVVATNYNCGSFTTIDAWHRLTVKAIGDISNSGKYLVGFVVFIDGNVVEDALVCDDAKGYDGYKAILNDVAALWDNKGQLFPSLKCKTADTISAIAVSGQGGIDDIAFTTTAPAWAKKSAATITWDANVDYVVVTDGDNVSTNYTSPKAVESDKTYTVTAKAKSGYALEAFTSSWAPDADATLEIKTVAAAAEFDGIGYATFADALAAANKSTKQATLKLWDDVETNESFNNEAGNWILDLNGNAIDNVEVENGILKIIDSGNGGSVGTLATYEGVSVTIADGKYDVLDLVDGTLEIEGGDAEFFDEITGGLKIADADDLKKLALVVNAGWVTTGKTFLQTDDIDLDGVAWAGIGAYGNKDNIKVENDYKNAGPFMGTYDGQGNSVTSIKLLREDYIGFFGSTLNATIKNLKLGIADNGFADSGSVSSDYCGGLFVGTSVNTTLENCETIAGGTFIGGKATAGIVGYAGGGTVLKGCVNNLNIKSDHNEKCAGLISCAQNDDKSWNVGYVTVDSCTNTANVTCGASNKHGGSLLVSYTDCEVKFQGNVVAQGTVTGTGTGRVQSIIALNGGSATVVDGAVITAPAQYKSIAYRNENDKYADGLNFATVDGDVATFVKNADVVAAAAAEDATYKVMSPIASFAYQFTGDAGEIAFLTGLNAPTFTITDKAGETVDPTVIEGGVKYVVSAQEDWPSEWTDIDADQGVKDKFAEWRKGDGAGVDLSTDLAKQAFLLNVAPDAVKPLVIEEINVIEGEAAIVVSTEKDLGGFPIPLNAINGVLFVEAGDTLEAMAPKAFGGWESKDGKMHGRIAAKFVKAVVGFKAPKAE